MRVFLMVGSLLLLAGCATKQETAAFNATLYDRCVTSAEQSGHDAMKACGASAAAHHASFSEKYDYFRDQYREQQRQEAAYDATHPEVVKYRQCYASMLAQPTRTGSLAEAMSNAQLVCSGQVPYAATRPAPIQTTNCQPNGVGGFTCTTQ